MFTHFYCYYDPSGRIGKTGFHRGDTQSKAQFAYNDALKKDRRMRQRCDASSKVIMCSLLTAVLSANPLEHFDDLFILACACSNLTNGQINMMLLLRQGKSNKQIQDILCIGDNGIEGCQQKIYATLQVHSRSEAVAKMEDLAKIFSDSSEPSL
jgi:DNA-binding NarL/FixJ family response regulator